MSTMFVYIINGKWIFLLDIGGDHTVLISIQHYVIKYVSDLRHVGGFLPGTPVSSTNNTDRHDIIEILLKVALNTITLNLLY